MKKQLIALGALLVFAVSALPSSAACCNRFNSYGYSSQSPCCAPVVAPCCPAAPVINSCCPSACPCQKPCCPAACPCAKPCCESMPCPACPCPAAPCNTCNDCCD